MCSPTCAPQRAVLPSPLQALLGTLEPLPGARMLTRLSFPLLVSAA